jgi:uncharacterized lipoprotein YmbA
MKHYKLQKLLMMAVCLMLAGCGTSPPTRYITLTATPQERHNFSGPPIRLGAVHLPPDLDRLWLTRSGIGGQLHVSSDVRWAAPLGMLVRNTLAVDLARALPVAKVILPGEPEQKGPVRSLVFVFTKFRISDTGNVDLAARCILLDDASQQTLQRRDVQVAVRAGSKSVTAAAPALSTALGRLADQIVAWLTHSAPGIRTRVIKTGY